MDARRCVRQPLASVDVTSAVRKMIGVFLQFGIAPNLCCDFASVSDRHDYIQQDQVWPKNPRALVSLDRVVLFKHEIPACFFEKNSNQVSGIRVVINN